MVQNDIRDMQAQKVFARFKTIKFKLFGIFVLAVFCSSQ